MANSIGPSQTAWMHSLAWLLEHWWQRLITFVFSRMRVNTYSFFPLLVYKHNIYVSAHFFIILHYFIYKLTEVALDNECPGMDTACLGSHVECVVKSPSSADTFCLCESAYYDNNPQYSGGTCLLSK